MRRLSVGEIYSFIGIILIKLLIDYLYVNIVNSIFAYEGYIIEFSNIKNVEGWMSYIVLYLILTKNKSNILYMTLLLSFILLITPTTTLFAYTNQSRVFFYILMISFAALQMLIYPKVINIKNLKHIKYGKIICIILSIISLSIVLLHYIQVVGIGNINFDLSKVYELRSRFDYFNNSGIFGYLNGWVIKVFNIFLIVWSLKLKRTKLFLLFLFAQIILFGFSNHKTVLFIIFLLLGLYLFDKFYHYTTILIYVVLSVLGLTFVYYLITDDVLLPSILIRRAFFVPAKLNFIYFDYFSSHEYLYWSNSILKSFIHYPYNDTITHILGEDLGHINMGANTGMFGSGFMHMGVLGIAIYVIILSLIINGISSISYNLPRWFVNSIVLIPVLSAIISSDLLTTMLTHGLLVSYLVLYLYSSNGQGIKIKKNSI